MAPTLTIISPVFDKLAVVKLDGYSPPCGPDDQPETEDSFGGSQLGSACWLVENFGFAMDASRGVLWTDFEAPGWQFSVLVSADHLAALLGLADEFGYRHMGTEFVVEPVEYGDGAGVATILRHPDGWCLAS